MKVAEIVPERTFNFEDALQRVIEAALRNEAALTLSAEQLQDLAQDLSNQVQSLPVAVSNSVESKLRGAAAAAAIEIQKKFTDADNAADQARERYESSVRFFSARSVAYFIALAILVCFGVTLAVFVITRAILPPKDILQQERQAQQAVFDLRPRGGASVITYCTTPTGDRLCVRTDERDPGPWGSNGETYRIIYGY